MPQTTNVAVLVGSLRKDSINRKAAQALARLAPEHLTLNIVEIGDLPLYNEDIEAAGAPEAWTRFREAVKGSDAVLFVTPEYNRSIPGALKNAIDVGSRPWGQAVFNGKPAAIMTVSPGATGGYGANHQLRQAILFFDMHVLQQPEAYIGSGGNLFDESGAFKSDSTRDFFKSFIDAFAGLIARNQAGAWAAA